VTNEISTSIHLQTAESSNGMRPQSGHISAHAYTAHVAAWRK